MFPIYFPLYSLFILANYKQEMHKLFSTVETTPLAEIDVGEFLGTLMSIMRKYHVKIEGNFSTLMIGTVVLEGIGRQLNPKINILKEAIPFLIQNQDQEAIQSTLSWQETLRLWFRKIFSFTLHYNYN